MSFSDVPVRQNGQLFEVSWVNLLRTAGVAVEGLLGSGFLGETSATINNGQVSAADITDLIFASASVKGAFVFGSVQRKTDSADAYALDILYAAYNSRTSTWSVTPVVAGGYSGITYSITAAGQLQYTSDTLAGGSYTGVIRFKAITFGG
jgi:hypothetical protein